MWLPGCDRSSIPLTEGLLQHAVDVLLLHPCFLPCTPCILYACGAGPSVGMGPSGAWQWWTKVSSSSSGHVQGTPTLGSCSLTSCLFPLSQFLSPPGKAIFLSSSHFPTNVQAKLIPAAPTSLELTHNSPGTGADFVIRLWECLPVYSSFMAEEKCYYLNATVYWDWVQVDSLEVIQLLLPTIPNLFYSYKERESGKFPFKGTKCIKNN